MNPKTVLIVFLIASSAVICSSNAAQAQIISNVSQGYEWKYNPDNGHYYAYVSESIPFRDARIGAESLGGYIVTITSQQEDLWISENFDEITWLGIDSGNWITREMFYSPFESEFFFGGNPYAVKDPERGWLDIPRDRSYPYIVEIGDPIIPTPTPTLTPAPVVYDWKYYPGNGHFYSVVLGEVGFMDAKLKAEELGGYLATFTTFNEYDWMLSILDELGINEVWIGLYYDKNDGWKWITNEELSISFWLPGEPTNLDEKYVHIRSGGWNNAPKTYLPQGYIIEIGEFAATPTSTSTPIPIPSSGGNIALVGKTSASSARTGRDPSFAIDDDIHTEYQGWSPIEDSGWWQLELPFEIEIYKIEIFPNTLNYSDMYRKFVIFSSLTGEFNGEEQLLVNETDWPKKQFVAYEFAPVNTRFIRLASIADHEWAILQEFRVYPAIEITPTPVPTSTLTPTLAPMPANWSLLNGSSLEENLLTSSAPTGYEQGRINFTDIPAGAGTDGLGMEIKLAPGQGAFISSLKEFDSPSLMHVSGQFKASNREAAFALVALNSPIDGQIGYTNVNSDGIPIDDYRKFNLIYAPPSGKMQYAVQAVNNPFSTLSTTVWVDNIRIEPFEPMAGGEPVALEIDGDFEGGLEKMLVNINGDDGIVIPFFESISDVAIRMSLDPSNLAANIGTICLGLSDQFPLRLLGQVSVKRESLPGGGMLAVVLTNGFQNLGVFRSADLIQDINSAAEDLLIIGGDFIVDNPDIPISAFVQIGGPDAEVSMVVDDLILLKE
ncbi:MAG: hypothetical protein JXR73_08885 [Candidatus Omnitrophica bacterium]|nr:hypothetical protein [Candidatus Omnitrophota bacterium]